MNVEERLAPSGETALQLIRTAAVVMNVKIGAFESNLAGIMRWAKASAEQKVSLAVYPEGIIPGYPSEDYIYYPDHLSLQRQALRKFVAFTATLPFKTVFVVGMTEVYRGMAYNVQVWVCNGIILGMIPKTELARDFSFTDGRNFNPGYPGMCVELEGYEDLGYPVYMGDLVFNLPFGRASGITCEDYWRSGGAMERRAIAGDALVMAVSNASDWRLGTYQSRIEQLNTRSSDYATTVVAAYQVGAHAGRVYDGGALFHQLGRHFPVNEPLGGRFREGLFVQDFDLTRVETRRRTNVTFRDQWTEAHRSQTLVRPVEIDCRQCGAPTANQPEYTYPLPWKGKNKSFFLPDFDTVVDREKEYFDEVKEGLLLAFTDFVEKNGFKRIVILESGGRDSFLVTVLASLYAERHFTAERYPDKRKRRAAIKDFAHCFSMPTKNNSDETKSIARDICAQVGFSFKEVPIQKLFNEAVKCLEKMVKGKGLNRMDLQNIQPRLRAALGRSVCATLMAALIGTGNATERGRVFYTKGGDQQADINMLGGVPKDVVNAWLAYMARQWGWPVFADLLETEASAELEPGQKDDDEMGPVPLNDLFLALLLGERLALRDMLRVIRQNFTDEELLALDPRATWEMVEKWATQYVRSCITGPHKHNQDPPSPATSHVHIDPKRYNRFPETASPEGFLFMA
ncbi:MAG TPA: NAD(+) synthase [Verrucomicrobiae bacterium]|nr:NAD(+) synthase [Verrucomicrobiae bacterium]